jgi:hypothetical protein
MGWSPTLGRDITLVGYGATAGPPYPDYGAGQRLAYNTIDVVGPNWIEYSGLVGEGATCSGDSGGPMFNAATELGLCVVGVTKGQRNAETAPCTEAGGAWLATRVDDLGSWIAAQTPQMLWYCYP